MSYHADNVTKDLVLSMYNEHTLLHSDARGKEEKIQ